MIEIISTDENNNDFAFLVREGWMEDTFTMMSCIFYSGID